MKLIKDFPNYAISEYGVVKNVKTGRILKSNPNTKGYLIIQISNKPIIKTITIHKLVYVTYVGEIPKGFEINHIDGNKRNNHYSNLELVTKKENMIKAVELGLIKSGSESPVSVGINQLNPITKEVINTYGSINIASKKTGIASSSISLASRGLRNSAGGFLWVLIK